MRSEKRLRSCQRRAVSLRTPGHRAVTDRLRRPLERERAGKIPDGCTRGARARPRLPASEWAARSLRPTPRGLAGPRDSLREAAAPATSWASCRKRSPRALASACSSWYPPSPPLKGHPHRSRPGTAVWRERHLLWGSAVWPGSHLPHITGRKRFKPQQTLTQAPTPAGQHYPHLPAAEGAAPGLQGECGRATLLTNSANWAPVRPGLPGHGQASESPHSRGQPPPAWPAGMGWSRASSPHGAPEKGQGSQVPHPHRHREELTLCPIRYPMQEAAGGSGWESSGLWVG